jgi:hypothetical protein
MNIGFIYGVIVGLLSIILLQVNTVCANEVSTTGNVSVEVIGIETWCSTNPQDNVCVELFNDNYITYSSSGEAVWNAP